MVWWFPATASGGLEFDAFRKSHEIDGSAVGAQTDYQMRIIANYGDYHNLEFADYDEVGYAVINSGDSTRPGCTNVLPTIIMRDPETMEAVLWGGKYWAVVASRTNGWQTNEFDVYSSIDLLSWTEEYKNIIPEVNATWEDSIYLASSFTYHEGDANPFLIFYCAYDGPTDTDRVKVGAARSSDMETWTKNPNNPLFDYVNVTWAEYGCELLSIARMSAGAAHKWIAVFEGESDDDRQGIGIAYNDDDDPDTTGWTYSNRSHTSTAAGIRREVDPWIYRDGDRYVIFYEIYPTAGAARPAGGMWADEADVFTEDTGWTRFSTNPILGSMSGAVQKSGMLYGVLLGGNLYLPFYIAANNSSMAIIDLLAQITLDSKCRTDFGDIRFTEDDGATELDYWIDEKVDGDYAIFWVEVSTIPASPASVTIYVYYGKDDETTTSDMSNTFVDSNPMETLAGFDARFTKVDGDDRVLDEATYDRTVIKLPDTSAITSTTYTTPIAFPTDRKYIFRYYYAGTCTGGDSPNGNFWVMGDSGAEILYFAGARGGASSDKRLRTDISYNFGTFAEGSLLLWELIVDGANRQVLNVKVEDGDEYSTDRGFGAAFDPDVLELIDVGGGALGDGWFGAWFIREYVDPEPTHGVWGAEEAVVWPF